MSANRNPSSVRQDAPPQNNRHVRLGLDRLEGREMPGMFLGELAALAGYGPLDLSPSVLASDHPTAPITVSEPSASTVTLAPAESPFSFPLAPPSHATNTAATSDLLPDFGADQPFHFGLLIADTPPSTTVPTSPVSPTPATGSASSEAAPLTPPASGSTGGEVAPLSEPISPPPPPTSPPPPPTSPPPPSGGSNQAPTANNDSYTVIHDRRLDVNASNGLLTNDSDPEGDALGIVVVTRPANGDIDFQTQSVSGDGSFSYLPKSGFVGTDTFTYKVYDDSGESGVATVTISVTNAAPTAVPDSYTTNEDQPLDTRGPVGGGGGGGPPLPPGGGGGGSLGLLANDTDADADSLGTVLVSEPANGLLMFNEDGTFLYTPNPNFSGTDTFQYATTDGIVSTSPKTVTITVTPRQSIDLDGKDDTTSLGWMSEPDEVDYGLGIAMSSPGYIMARDPVAPAGAGWHLQQRQVFSSDGREVLAIGGVTMPAAVPLPPTGDQVLSVVALQTGFVATSIQYQEVWQNTLTNMTQSSITTMQVKEVKATLVSNEFTSTHEVLQRNGTGNEYRTAGKKYVPAYVVGKDNGWMSQTRHTSAKESKVKLTLTFKMAGKLATDLNTKKAKIKGDSGETALKFDTGDINMAVAGGQVVLPLTATNNIGSDLRTIKDTIKWTIQVEGQAEIIDIGKTDQLVIYVTYGKPQTTAAGINDDALVPTPARMDRAMAVIKKAFDNAKAETGVNEPKPQRIVYQAVQLHKFNGSNYVLAKGDVYAWRVYDDWTNKNGADCISGTALIACAALMMGMPGTVEAKRYTVLSDVTETDLTTATEYDPINDINRYRNGQKEILALSFDGGYNAFEGTVVYKHDSKTFYFPVGNKMEKSVDSKHKVLRRVNASNFP